MKPKDNILPSEQIASFCSFLNESMAEYRRCQQVEDEMEKLTQDYLHILELGELSYRERARISNELVGVRRQRRIVKDRLDALSPLVEFCDNENNKKVVNTLRNVLGAMRKIEEKTSTRFYVPRVLDEKSEMVQWLRRPSKRE